ncbi:heme exporter protein CcmD [Haliea atlantica]|jgi:heme exporter protein D|nr:heme exporter protein CcmD [Haliea sp.]|tara:strand:+ start:1657 stop:1863 length:207 start_codon:yes stop_codon:yes gene_type:complete
MYFESLSAALTMNGHGAFVWSAYAITAVVLVGMLVAPWRRQRRTLRQLTGLLKREAGQPPPRDRSREV